MRYPEKALKYGINFLSECFTDLPTDVFKTVHACCGYPTYLVKPYFYSIILMPSPIPEYLIRIPFSTVNKQ